VGGAIASVSEPAHANGGWLAARTLLLGWGFGNFNNFRLRASSPPALECFEFEFFGAAVSQHI
jgi:hypothetical protein